jgi:hypothetical protein
MSKENFAEKMKVAKEAKKAKEMNEAYDAAINDLPKEAFEDLDERELKSDKEKQPIKITSTEIQVISSEFHNFGNALFEKNKPTFLTEKVLSDLEKLPNFKALVEKGVIKIGL